MVMDAYLGMGGIGNGWHSSYVTAIIVDRRMELEGSSGCIPHHLVSPLTRTGPGGETTSALLGLSP